MNVKNRTVRSDAIAPIELTEDDRRAALTDEAEKIADVLRSMYNDLLENASKFAGYYISNVRNRPYLDEKVKSLLVEIPSAVWYDLDQIGRGLLNKRLLFGYANVKSFLRRLPPTEQERCVSEPIEVVVKTATGWDTLRVDVKSMNTDQCRQVFSKDHIRSIPEQRATIEQNKTVKNIKARSERAAYYVSPEGFLVVNVAGTQISYEALKLEMKKIATIRKGCYTK
jgi:hypothetical protein